MRPGVPWNVKDISPEAREAAQVAAARAGMSLGEWLSQAIAQEAKTVAAHEAQAAARAPYRPQSPPPPQYPAQQYPAPQNVAPIMTPLMSQPEPAPYRPNFASAADALHAQTRNSEFTVVAHGLRDLADRLETTERRQQQAISAINQNVAAMADKVDAADRIKNMAETAFATAADAINQSTRDQAAAFESLEKTVGTLSERLAAVEGAPDAAVAAREAVSSLETSLEGFKSRLSEAERRGSDAQSSLDNWVKTLSARIEASGHDTTELVRTSSAALERNLDQVRGTLAEQERRQAERAEALTTIQNGLIAIRNEVSESERRSKETISGLEAFIKEVSSKADTSGTQAELTQLTQSVAALKTELQALAAHTAAEAAQRDAAQREAQSRLEGALQSLTTQIAQSQAAAAETGRTAEQNFQALSQKLADGETRATQWREDLSAVQAQMAAPAAASPDIDVALSSLNASVEQLSQRFQAAEQEAAQAAQRQAAAVRKVEDMVQGFARGLDHIADVSKGPLAQPMAAVQATLEAITTKIEDGDSRSAEQVQTIEAALKTLAERIEQSEQRQTQTAAQLTSAATAVTQRLDASEQREAELQQKLEDSFRDVIDRIEDSERKAGDAVEAIEAGMGTLSQRLDAADRRHKEAVAGLRLTVDGLVAKAAAEPLLARANMAAYSVAPQILSGPLNAQPQAYQAPPAPSAVTALPPAAPELPPVMEAVPPPPAAKAEAIAAAPLTALPPPADMEPPAPTFDELVARAVPQADAPATGPLPPLDTPAPPKRADDFLAQARKAAQAAALADQAQQQALANAKKPGAKRAKDPYAPQDNERNYGRLAIYGLVFVALICGAIALIILAPWRTADDVNRPTPGSSLGEMSSPEAAAKPSAPAATTFTELPPPPDMALPAPATAALGDTAPTAFATTPAIPEPAAVGATANGFDANLEDRAKRGDAKAQYILAIRYAEGRNAPKDMTKAIGFMKQAAAAGMPAAQYRMGTIYERGEAGVAKDAVQARVWYEKAALNGNRKAMHNLAVLHAEGVGTPANMTEASKWFQRGAEFGLTDSQYNLGILYERGLGVARNPVEAAKWFAIAAAQGDADAAGRLDVIRKDMPAGDVNKALGAARTFAPKTPSPTANDSPQAGG
jgi:localization factor PodJL